MKSSLCSVQLCDILFLCVLQILTTPLSWQKTHDTSGLSCVVAPLSSSSVLRMAWSPLPTLLCSKSPEQCYSWRCEHHSAGCVNAAVKCVDRFNNVCQCCWAVWLRVSGQQVWRPFSRNFEHYCAYRPFICEQHSTIYVLMSFSSVWTSFRCRCECCLAVVWMSFSWNFELTVRSFIWTTFNCVCVNVI